MSVSKDRRPGPGTLGVHGTDPRPGPGAPVVPPVVQSATFYWSTPEDGELLYSRYGNNPNQLQVGRKVAALEGAEAAVALGSGMGATAMSLLSVLDAGDHVVASSRLYGATYQLLASELPRRGMRVRSPSATVCTSERRAPSGCSRSPSAPTPSCSAAA